MNATSSHFIKRPWGTMAVHEWAGVEPPFLFLHGNGCTADDWGHVRPHLPEPARTLAIDFPGHGASATPGAPYFMMDLVADTLALIESRQLKNVILVGHSLGGMAGIEVAFRSPAISALVLVEGWTNSAAWGAFAFQDHHFGCLSDASIAALKATSRLMEERVPATLMDPFWKSVCDFDGYAMLQQLAIPVFEIYGTAGWRDDTMARLSIPEKPNIRLHRIEGAGHYLLHERPAEVAWICEEARQMTIRNVSS